MHSPESWAQVKGEPCVFHWSFPYCRIADVQNKTTGHVVKVKAEFPVLAKSLLLCKLSQTAQYPLPSGVFSHTCCNSKRKMHSRSAQLKPTSQASAGRSKGSRGGAERSSESASPFPAPWEALAGAFCSPFTGPWALPAVDICSSLLELFGATVSRHLWVSISTALLCPRFPNSDQAKLHPFSVWQHNFYQLYQPSMWSKDPFLHAHMCLHSCSQLWIQISSPDSSGTVSS